MFVIPCSSCPCSSFSHNKKVNLAFNWSVTIIYFMVIGSKS
uniref:Uncharacterized protein n=1 Tax=Rhizophora mucronata TaxID=61149 RepID=A0A2P2MSM2_RHIMU